MPSRILLIDDMPTVLTGVKDAIEDVFAMNRRGCPEIDTATNFNLAINKLNKHDYDIISLDLSMASIRGAACFDEHPGTTLNGWLFLKHYLFCETARFREKCSNTKVLIFSGYIDILRSHINNLSPEENEQVMWFANVDLVSKTTGEYELLAQMIADRLP